MIQGVLQSTFLRLSSIVFVGNLLSQILIFIAYALFARYFDRIEIGIYTVFISLSILLAVPSTGRYELARLDGISLGILVVEMEQLLILFFLVPHLPLKVLP